MVESQNYKHVRDAAEAFYKKIGYIRCPALNHELVHFTNEGFRHLMFKGKRRRSERDKRVQMMKFKLLPKAKDVIEIATTFQEYDEELTEVVKKRKKRQIKEPAMIKYWGFVAIIDGYRLKVIVRQIGNGQKHFWSTIPAWTKSHYREIKLLSKSKGNLAED